MRDLSNLPDQVAASQAWLHVPAPPQRRPTDSERRTLALMGAPWITADMAYRRAALVATGGFDERFRPGFAYGAARLPDDVGRAGNDPPARLAN
jgi:hypothetical protein